MSSTPQSVQTGETASNPAQKGTIDAVVKQLSLIKDRRPSILLAEGRSVNAQVTIKKIIAAASLVFQEDGHSGLTLRRVATRADIAVGNLTYHFPSRDKLLEAVIRENLADYVEAHLQEIKTSDSAPIDLLLNIAEFYVHNAHTSYPFFVQLWSFAGSSEESRSLLDDIFKPLGRFVYYLVRAANPALPDREIRRATLMLFSLEARNKLYIGMAPKDAMAVQTAAEDIRSLVYKLVMH